MHNNFINVSVHAMTEGFFCFLKYLATPDAVCSIKCFALLQFACVAHSQSKTFYFFLKKV